MTRIDKRALIPSVILAVSIMIIFSAAAFSSDWFTDYNAEELHEQKYTVPDGDLVQWPGDTTDEPAAGTLEWQQWKDWHNNEEPKYENYAAFMDHAEFDVMLQQWNTWKSWTNSINYQLFEEFGPILLVLALLMFGSIIGGVYIAKEDDNEETEEDST